MKQPYYLFNGGRMSRKDNTLKFTPVDEEGKEGMTKYLPIEGVSELFIFGSLDVNSALLNFLGQQHIPMHFFDYYEHYTGSFCPREYLLSGKMQVEQTKHYIDPGKRLSIARSFVEGAAYNMLKNLRYYDNREKDLQSQITAIESYVNSIPDVTAIDQLMGLEGNIRQTYYSGFDIIVNDFQMGNRTKRPPTNELNTLISFGNMMCYTACMSMIYHTQLNPTISFLHEPGARRFSLALDLAEIFKPILVDRTIFKVLNKKTIQSKDFMMEVNGCTLKNSGKETFSRAFEERLKETIKHRTLNKYVSYRHLIKLECYKLGRHVLNIDQYKPLKMWW